MTIKYLGEAERWKRARTRLPETAEFAPLRKVLESGDQAKNDLLGAVAAELKKSVEAHPSSQENPVVPDDLYHATLARAGLLNWENAFGGSEKAAKFFGLVAWTYFFDDDSAWLAKAPDTPGLGKRAWTYYIDPDAIAISAAAGTKAAGLPAIVDHETGIADVVGTGAAERSAPAVSRAIVDRETGMAQLPTEAAGLVLNQCVYWKTKKRYGRIAARTEARSRGFRGDAAVFEIPLKSGRTG